MSQDKNVLTLQQNTNNNFGTIETRQEFVTVPVAVPGGDPSSRLMGTKIVRIHFASNVDVSKDLKSFIIK